MMSTLPKFQCTDWTPEKLTAAIQKDIPSLTAIIVTLRKASRWDPEAEYIEDALEDAYRKNTTEVIQVLLSEDIPASAECLYWAVTNGNIDLVKTTIQNLKSVGRWDPGNGDIADALENAYCCNNREIIQVLLSSGVLISTLCLYWAIRNGDTTQVKNTIQQLKLAGRWDPTDENINDAFVEAYSNNDLLQALLSECIPIPLERFQQTVKNNDNEAQHFKSAEDLEDFESTVETATAYNKEKIHLLLSSEEVMTTAYLSLAIRHLEITLVKDTIQALKAAGKLELNDNCLNLAISETFARQNMDMIKLLMSDGIITTQYFQWATKYGDEDFVKNAIVQLMTTTPGVRVVGDALQDAYQRHDTWLIHELISTGAEANKNCLIPAVISGDTDLVKLTVKYLKSIKRWNPEDKEIDDALEEAFRRNNMDMVHALINEECSIKPQCLHVAVHYEYVDIAKLTIQHLKSVHRWNPEDTDTMAVVDEAYRHNNLAMVKMFIDEGCLVNSRHLYLAVTYGDMSLVKITTQHLKSTGKWDPSDRDTSDALDEAYSHTHSNKDIIYALLSEGVIGTTLSVYWAVTRDEKELMKKTIEHLKAARRWEPKDLHISDALEVAFLTKNIEIARILISEKAFVTRRSLYEVLASGNLQLLEITIENLKFDKRWNPRDDCIKSALEDAYKQNNEPMVKLLMSEDASITSKSLLFATKNQNSNLVKIAANHLKEFGEWDPEDADVHFALEEAFSNCQDPTIASILLSEGATITTRCLKMAVPSADISQIKATVQDLHSKGLFDVEDPDITAALEVAYIWKKKNIAEELLSAGVQVTPTCLESAVLHDDASFVQTTLQHLKDTGKWNPDDVHITNALEKVFLLNKTKVAEVLISEGVSVTSQCWTTALNQTDVSLITSVINQLKLTNRWNPEEENISTALLVHELDSSLKTNQGTINVLISESAPLSISSLHWAIKFGNPQSVASTIQKLKSTDKWMLQDQAITDALELAYRMDNAKAVELLQDKEHVPITPICLKHAVINGSEALVERAILQLKAEKQLEQGYNLLRNLTKQDTANLNPSVKDKLTKDGILFSSEQGSQNVEDDLSSDYEPNSKKVQCYQQEKKHSPNRPSVVHSEPSSNSNLTKDCRNPAETSTQPSVAAAVFTDQANDVEDKRFPLTNHHENAILNSNLSQQSLHGAKKILENICEKLKEQEQDNCINVYPAYKCGKRWKPYIVLLEKEVREKQWMKFGGVDVFCRRYDQVSFEASAVMNSKKVQQSLPDVKETEAIRQAILRKDLLQDHSNITLISSCPFRSRKEGKELIKQTCIVIHCLLKGFIPFGEDPFPKEVEGIPVDVREGYCVFGMNTSTQDSKDNVPMECSSSEPTEIKVTVGPKSDNYNKRLRLGTGIGPSEGFGRGTLGGFVKFPNNNIGFLTCSHVLPEGVGSHVSQPADDDMVGSGPSYKCGVVVKEVFDPGAHDRAGVDAALVEITDTSRIPSDGDFIVVSKDQTRFAGFDPANPPKFQTGKLLRTDEITNEQKRMSVIKYGSETGLTLGLVHQNGTYGRQVTPVMELPNTCGPDFLERLNLQPEQKELVLEKRTVAFFDQFEILSIAGTSSQFFALGDSGSLVFLSLDSGLCCVGMAIGVTNYHSCIVTPIENIVDRLSVEFVDFTKP